MKLCFAAHCIEKAALKRFERALWSSRTRCAPIPRPHLGQRNRRITTSVRLSTSPIQATQAGTAHFNQHNTELQL
jgi:hypothetical protein